MLEKAAKHVLFNMMYYISQSSSMSLLTVFIGGF